jgi:hypothetical protein
LGDAPLASGSIQLGLNRVRIAVVQENGSGREAPLRLAFEEQSGWLVTGLIGAGWVAELSEDQRAAFAAALTGVYKLAGVNLVREQIESALGPESMAYDIADLGLVVWPGGDYDTEVNYDLRQVPVMLPESANPFPAQPVLEPRRIVFSRRPLPWRRWVEVWESEHAGHNVPNPLLDGMPVLSTESRTGGCPQTSTLTQPET